MTLYRDALIEDSDVSIFSILTAMSQGDRTTLLDIVNLVRNETPGYTYLEVGSDQGGSIVAPLSDSRCAAALSVDLRPASQPDERGVDFNFPENSAARMRKLLVEAGVPRGGMLKLRTFDADISALTMSEFGRLSDLVFIDAEHTNKAVFRDFVKVRRFMKSDAIILFHDSQLIFDALINIETMLDDEGVDFCSLYMPTTIFGIAFGKYEGPFRHCFEKVSYDKNLYIEKSRLNLRAEIAANQKRS